MVSSKEKSQTQTEVKDERTLLDAVASFFSLGSGLFLVGYCLIYRQENLNYFLLSGRFLWLFAMLIATFQDEILSAIQKGNGVGRSGSESKTSIGKSDGTIKGINVATTVEYNRQVRLVIGMIAYSIAAYLLVILSSTNITETMNSHASRTATHFNSSILDVFSDSSVIRTLAKATTSDNIIGTYYSQMSYLSYAFGVMASFHSFDATFSHFFLTLPSGYEEAAIEEHGFKKLEKRLALPLLLIGMILSKSIDSTEFNNHYMQSVITALFGWIIYKLISFVTAFIANVKATSMTATALMDSSPMGTQLIKEHAAALSVQDTVVRPYIWRLYGNEYDVSDYVKQHPGGIETIMLGANREDATALFQSYHPFNIKKARAVLEKYRINPPETSATAENADVKVQDQVIIGHTNDLFYDVLCQRVRKVLLDNNIDPVKDRGGNLLRFLWYATVVIGTVLSCIAHCKGSIVGSVLFAMFGDFMAANLGHDGGHFAVCRTSFINDIAVWGMGVITNPIIWQHQHTYAHHSHTNDDAHDPDLHHFRGLLQLRKGVKETETFLAQTSKTTSNNRALSTFLSWLKKKFKAIPDDVDDPIVKESVVKKNQSSVWFILFIYTEIAMAMCVWFPSRFIMERSMHGVVGWSDRRRWFRTFCLYAHFVLYTSVIMVLPFFQHTSSLYALACVMSHMFTSSLLFGVATQVGHITELTMSETSINEARSKRHPIAQNSWAAEQVVTTNDFCPQDIFVFLPFGGLGLQIEHHLFPGLNHCHLMKIQPTVEATCKEYNVSYSKYETYMEALYDTIKYLQGV